MLKNKKGIAFTTTTVLAGFVAFILFLFLMSGGAVGVWKLSNLIGNIADILSDIPAPIWIIGGIFIGLYILTSD